MYMYIYTYTCIFIYVYVHIFIYSNIYININLYLSIYIYLYLSSYMYVYLYRSIYQSICLYANTYIPRSRRRISRGITQKLVASWARRALSSRTGGAPFTLHLDTRVQGLELRVQGSGFRDLGVALRGPPPGRDVRSARGLHSTL
jgi:hypothetical protein